MMVSIWVCILTAITAFVLGGAIFYIIALRVAESAVNDNDFGGRL